MEIRVLSEIRELFVADMGAQGDGVAAGPVFVPLTLPGERVQARVAGARGEVAEVLSPSPERVAPPCPHFGACGGCALQHWAHEPYLAWKAAHIRRLLEREGIRTEFAEGFAAAPGTRRRVALHARRAKGGAAVGFKARRSWDLVPIEVCPISERAIVEALPSIRTLAAPFLEHPKSAPTLHVSATLTGLDIDVTGVERRSGGLSADARLRAAEAAAAADFARVTMAGEIVYQARAPMVRFGRASVALPAGGFLQAVAGAEDAMARIAADACRGAGLVADLYCGAGAFTFRLAEVAPVLAADVSAEAVAALKAAIATAPGLKAIMAEARDLVRRPMLANEIRRCEAVVFDPPRAGALEQAREIAGSGAAVCVAVSCNPATFARDAKVLVDGGFTLERVHPIDQFLWSPHVELVGVFRR